MFVKNRESRDFHYRKNGKLTVLKAGTVSYVDENLVTSKELIACYGQRIEVISRDLVAEVAPQAIAEEKEASLKSSIKEPLKKVETVKKEDLNDSFIEKVLNEIKDESKSVVEKKKPEVVLPVKPEEKKPEVTVVPAKVEEKKPEVVTSKQTAKASKTTKTKATTKTRKPRTKKA